MLGGGKDEQPLQADRLAAIGAVAIAPDIEAVQWYGIVAPARTPEAVIATLNREINKALASPALRTRLDAEGALADPMSPQAFGSMIGSEIARWKPVIEKAQMKPE